MTRPYVCLRCRTSQIARIWSQDAARRPQWARSAHQAAATDTAPPAADEDTGAGAAPAQPSAAAPSPTDLWAAYQRHRQPNQADPPEPPPPSTRAAAALSGRLGPLGRPLDAGILEGLARPDKSPSEVWAELSALPHFRSAALPEALEIRFRKAPALRAAFTGLVRAGLFGLDSDLPPFEEVVDAFCRRGLFNYTLLHDVVRLAAPELQAAAVGGGDDGYDCSGLLRKVLWTWRYVANGPFGHLAVGGEGEGGWEGLRAAAELERKSTSHKSYSRRFRAVMNGKIDKSTEEPLAANSALLVLYIERLRARGAIPADLQADCDAWTGFLLDILRAKDAAGKLALPHINQILQHVPDGQIRGHRGEIVKAWAELQRSYAARSSEGPGVDAPPRAPRSEFVPATQAERWRGQLHRAAKQNSRREALKLWLDYQDVVPAWTSTKEKSEVLAEFMWTFARVGLPLKATEVWQSLSKYGVEPALNHWTAMIEVCRLSHDRTSLTGIWILMRESGIVPPNQTWTAYIKALLNLRDRNSALKAVRDMGLQWQTGTKPPGTEPAADYQPSMIPVNAAMSGLFLIGYPKDVPGVLTWANQQGLARTTDTYNILLRQAIRQQQHSDRPRELLKEMKAGGCEPDVITFTIFIDGLVRNPNSPFLNEPAEAQQEAILQLLDDMGSVGLEPNAQTYGTLLHSLLDGGRRPNLAAAQAVLNRMGDDGIQPSAHICTILATHYFAQDPPGLAAIEALCARAEAGRRGGAGGTAAAAAAVDRSFYDRLVEGYAELGMTEKMLRHLRRRMDRPPSWKALRLALRALAEREEWALAAELVGQVEAERDLRAVSNRDKDELRGWRSTVQALREEQQLQLGEGSRAPVRRVLP